MREIRGRNDEPEPEKLEVCPECGQKQLALTTNGLKYKCKGCGKAYTWEEINL